MTRRRTGLPDVDALIDVAETEQTKLDATMVTGRAENVVRAAREAELVAAQQAARRRVSAAKGRLTRAQRDGDAARIAAARAQLDQAHRDFDRISDDVIRQLRALLQARFTHLDEVFEQIPPTWAAGSAVIDALAHPRPATGPTGPDPDPGAPA